MPSRAWTQRTFFVATAAALLASSLNACGGGSTTSTLPPLMTSTVDNAAASVAQPVISQPIVSAPVAPQTIGVPGVRRVESLTTSGFAPSQIANLAAWYDASDSRTVLLSANGVSAWSDKSGHGNDVGQVNPSAQPAYAAQSVNGRNTLHFAGHSFMTSVPQNFSTHLFNESTVFLVTNQSTVPQTSTVVWSGVDHGNPRYDVRLAENGVTHFDFNNYLGGRLAATDVPTGVALWTARGSVSGHSQTFSKDGAVIASNSTAAASVSGNYPLVLGGMTGAGQYSDFFDGNLAEVVIYQGALGSAQVSEVEGYLACKWGLQSQLPVAHLYRTVCPGGVVGPTPAPSPIATIPPVSNLPSENPIWANDFVDSIGINTHCTYSSWSDCQPHASTNPTPWIAALKTLGIRHIRDGFFGPNGAPFLKTDQYRALSNATGMRYDFVINEYNSSSTAAFAQAMSALPGAIDAFEIGGNEPDSPWNSSYDECQATFGTTWACWPQQVTSQVAKDSQPVRSTGAMAVGPSVEFGNSYNSCTRTAGATFAGKIVATTACPSNGMSDLSTIGNVANQTSLLDACNMHPYTDNNPGWSGLAAYMVAERSYCRSTPWITENGYSTSGSGDLRISKYEPRIFAEDWYEGVRRTYTFEFADTPAAGAFFAPFGLVAFNGSGSSPVYAPKLQYESLRSLIGLMNDQGPRPNIAPLQYQLTASSSIHHILAQRRDGSYQLLLWKEVRDTGSPQLETVALQIAGKYNHATVAEFTPQTGQYTSRTLTPVLRQGNLDYGPIVVSDAMSIYRFSTSPIGAAQAPARAGSFTMASRVP